jgi:hypothetical protein
MSIDWPDYGIPALGRVIWDEIYQLIQRTPGKIAVYCEGGHGRTGTFLSIIAHRFGYREPVKHIRQVYCRKAVESLAQINYIKSFGITVKESPASDYNDYGSFSYNKKGATTYKKNGEKLPCNHTIRDVAHMVDQAKYGAKFATVHTSRGMSRWYTSRISS